MTDTSVITEIGKWFAGSITPALNWIALDGNGPGLALIVLIAGAGCLTYIIISGYLDLRLIYRANQALTQERVKCEQSYFSEDYNKICQDMAKIKKISNVWDEFVETLIKPENSETKIPFKNTKRPHDFFNLYDLHMGPDFTKSLPSIFVGIGLALTFFGLIAALSKAAATVNDPAATSVVMQDGIIELLSAASAKFYASLVALFVSVVLTVSIKLTIYRLSSDVTTLNNHIEDSMKHETQEQLSAKNNQLMQAQLDQMEAFNTDLAMQVGKEVQASLDKSLSPLVEKMADMGGDITESNMNNLKKITEEVTKGIQGAAGESMDRVASTLDKVSDKLGGLSDILSSALSNFDADFKKMLDGLKSSLEESTHSVAEGVEKTMTGMNEGIQESASTVTGLVANLANTIEDLSRSGEKIAAAGGEALSASVSAAAEAAGASIANAGKELSSGFKDSTKDLVDSFSTITNRLNELNTSLLEMPQNLSKINVGLGISSDSISAASEQFSVAGGKIKEYLEPIAEFVDETREVIKELEQNLTKSSEGARSSAESINESVQILKNEIGSQLKELSQGDDKLGTMLMKIEESTKKVLESINTYTQAMDEGFGQAGGTLKTCIGDLEEVLDNHAKQLGSLKTIDNNKS